MIERQFVSMVIVFWLVVIGFIGMINFEPVSAGSPQVHAPILIEGDANFTTANGVTGGNGTEAEPYIITGWDINSTGANGIEIRNTSAYFIIQNVSVYSVNNSNKCIYLYNTSNSVIENNTIHGNDYGIYLKYSDNSRIADNNITNNSKRGISLTGSTDCEIINNSILGSFEGVYFESFSDRNKIFTNNISFNYFGIYIHKSHENNVSDNAISYHSTAITFSHSSKSMVFNNIIIKNQGFGINLISSSRIILIHNNISYCNYGGCGIRLVMTSFNNSIIDNHIWKSNTGIYLKNGYYNDIKYNEFTEDGGGIYMLGSSGNNVSYNLMFNTGGIGLIDSSDNYVSENNISSSSYGIEVEGDSENNYLIENTLRNCHYGIILNEFSTKSRVYRNSITFNTDAGIRIRVASDNWILDNDITGNRRGVENVYSNNNHFEGNNISSNEESGMLVYDSEYNIIKKNTFHNDPYYGLDLDDSHSNIVNDNEFSGNDISIRIYMSNFNGINGNRITNSYNTIFLYFSSDNVIEYNTARNNVYGITLNDQSLRNIISYNELSNFYTYGISMDMYTESTIVSKNRIENCSWGGIIISYSNSNEIKDNEFYSNSNYDIILQMSTYNKLSGNKMESNGIIIGGGELSQWNTNTIDTTNLVNNKPVYFWTDRVGGKVPAGAGQVILANCRNVEIDGQDLSDTSTSIILGYSHNNKISNNAASSNLYDGISLYRSDNNTIIDNIVNMNKDDGIVISYSRNNTVKGSIVSSNNDDGIYFSRYCIENEVIANSIDSNIGAGINVGRYSLNNSFSNNSISNNEIGIYLFRSINAEITNNTVSFNENGIVSSRSNENRIYHNNFIENKNQTHVYYGNDRWNLSYPYGGNYWSDFNGSDTKNGPEQDKPGPDGMGDTGYPVGETNDSYPLMKPFVPKKLLSPNNFQLRSGYSFIQLNWDAPNMTDDHIVINYLIYRSPIPGKMELLIKIGNTTNYNDTDVINGQTYYYRVCAENMVGVGHPTEELNAMPGAVPSAPLTFFSFIEKDRLKLAWDPPAFDGGSQITGYRIYKGVESGVTLTTIDVGNIVLYADDDVTKGVVYYYRVSAVNQIGVGAQTEEAAEIIYSVPFAPLNLTANPGDSFINLTWKPPENDGGHEITMFYINKNTTAGGFEAVAKAHPDILFYNDTDVINGVTYTYTVQAKNKLGKGEFTPEVSAKAGRVIIPSTNKQPRAMIRADNSTGIAPLTIHFNGSGFDPDGAIVSYKWDFGDGNTSSEQNPIYTYKYPGTFYVKLMVFDNEGSAGLSMITIKVNTEPVDPPDIPESQKNDDKTSAWPIMAVGVLISVIASLILLFFVLPTIAKRSQPSEAVKKRQKKDIFINRIHMRIKQPLEAEIVTDNESVEPGGELLSPTQDQDPEAEDDNIVESSDEIEE